MNAILINLLIQFLGRMFTPALVKAYEPLIRVFLESEMAKGHFEDLEKAVICKLIALTADDPGPASAVAMVAAMLGFDVKTCKI